MVIYGTWDVISWHRVAFFKYIYLLSLIHTFYSPKKTRNIFHVIELIGRKFEVSEKTRRLFSWLINCLNARSIPKDENEH